MIPFVFFSFVLTVGLILLLEPISKYFGLVDAPGGRKKHDKETPLVGGVAMFIAYAITTVFSDSSPDVFFLFFSFIMVLYGAMDDYQPQKAHSKFIIQLSIGLLTALFTNSKLVSFGDLLLIGPIDLGFLSVPITVFAIVSVINATNMMDGIDGLAGGISLVSFVSLALLLPADIDLFKHLSILSSVIAGFMLFNIRFSKKPARIFMGDAGSMFLGYALAWHTIAATQSSEPIYPVTMLWLLCVPLYDFMTVVLSRILSDRKVSQPGRDHIHHMLYDAGLSKPVVCLVLIGFAIAASSIGILLQQNGIEESISFVLYLILYAAYFSIIRLNFKNLSYSSY